MRLKLPLTIHHGFIRDAAGVSLAQLIHPDIAENDELVQAVNACGLTIRQEFAKAAMQGLCANPEMIPYDAGELEETAVAHADRLIAELDKESGK